MKWALYNILFALVYPFLLPGFLLRMLRRGGYAARMGDRFALYPEGFFGKDRPLYDSHGTSTADSRRTTDGFVWIHAVSVGEVQVAGQLMREWRAVEPDVRFCFSTTSSTGWKIAEKELSTLNPQPSTSADVLIYNPLDFPNFVKSALRTVRPRAIVLTESEIWPNFILQAKKMGIPLFLINARVSDRSAPRYKAAKWFFGDVLSAFTRIFAQSDLDKARLVAAGAQDGKVEVTGSFKFDVAHRNEAKEQELRKWILGSSRVEIGSSRVEIGSSRVEVGSSRVEVGSSRAEVGSDRVEVGSSRVEVATRAESDAKDASKTLMDPKILLGGSTWPGEDEVLLKIYKRLLAGSVAEAATDRMPILVIAPRHFEKADAIEVNIRKAGFACVRRSREGGRKTEDGRLGEGRETQDGKTVFLADTTGELMGLYGIADVVFVGKSLCAHGSQNMIEPCLCGKPTFVGPYTENFRPVMSDLLASRAIVQVKDAAELEEKIVEIFASLTSGGDAASPLGRLGERAKAAVANRLGVVAKCVREIREAL